MSIAVTAVSKYETTETSNFTVQPGEYAGMRYLTMGPRGDGTYVLAVSLGPGAGSQYAAPGGPAHAVFAPDVETAVSKGCAVFANMLDAISAAGL